MASLLNFFDNNGNLIEVPALRGPEGPQGPKGDTGPQGPQGLQGIQGPKGDAANAYEVAQQMGYEGTVEDFMASLKGADGQNGRDGESAYEIAQRITGNIYKDEHDWLGSLQGTNGQDGAPGESAYEIAQRIAGNVYKGESDWLASLQGAQGVQGPKGDTGNTGPQGPKGDTGDTGAQGPAGNSGAWHGTINEFEALSSYSSTTIYFIYPPAQQTWTSGFDSNSNHILNIGDLTNDITITGTPTSTLVQQKENLHAVLGFSSLTINSVTNDTIKLIEITNPLLKLTGGTVSIQVDGSADLITGSVFYDNVEDKFYIQTSTEFTGGTDIIITLDLPLDIFYAFRPYTVPNHSEVTAFKMIQSVTFKEALNEYGITLELG